MLGFKLGLLYGMVLGAPVGYPLRYSINIFLAWNFAIHLVHGKDLWFMIGTGEGYLVGLSLGLPLGSPLDSPNPVSELPDTLLGAPLGLWFGSEVARCLCYFQRLMDLHEDNFWGVGISCVPTSGYSIASKINSVKYFQLMELLKLSLLPTCLIPTSGGR